MSSRERMIGHTAGMQSHVELWDVDHYVLAVDQYDLTRWTSQGYVLADTAQRMLGVDAALARAGHDELVAIWSALFGPGLPEDGAPCSLRDDLREAALRPAARLQVLCRELPRGFADKSRQRKDPERPPRLDTAHYIVFQAVDPHQKPVAGVQLELVIAGGEVKNTVTNKDGFARVERIHAGSVVMRVLSVDGSMWKPLDGAASKLSSTDERVRWHSVVQGECLSKIAHQYKLEGWKRLWEHPKNEPLRKQRKSPHVLHPGDVVAVPGIEVREIVRETDATHRVQIKDPPPVWFRLKLLDKKRKPVERGSYEILLEGELHAEGNIENGKVECAVPVHTKEAVLVAHVDGKTIRRTLQLSALDPLEESSGLQGRLSNLGHFSGEVGGADAEALQFALREFRATAGLRESEEPDDELRSALEREHLV